MRDACLSDGYDASTLWGGTISVDGTDLHEEWTGTPGQILAGALYDYGPGGEVDCGTFVDLEDIDAQDFVFDGESTYWAFSDQP